MDSEKPAKFPGCSTKIKEIYPTIKRQYKVKWCKNKLCLPYDFAIEELKIIIELDGEQHFTQVSNWTSPETQIENDKFKELPKQY